MTMNMLLVTGLCLSLAVSVGVGSWAWYRLRETRFDLFDAQMAAYSDPGTGMDNRRALLRYLHRKSGGVTAVAIVSLHGLGDIRGAYGHRTAEAVFAVLMRRSAHTRVCNAAEFRLAADEIILVWTGPPNIDELRKLCDALMKPIPATVDGRAVQLTVAVSAGVYAVQPDDGTSVVLSRADTALRVAIRAGLGHITTWKAGLRAHDRLRQRPPMCAVIEFHSMLPPEVVTGFTADLLARQVVRVLAERAKGWTGPLAADDPEFDLRHPIPDPDAPDADIADWLSLLKAATTSPAVTFLDHSQVHHCNPRPSVTLTPHREPGALSDTHSA
ncbi:diguanylate cyclase [Catellatospora sp. NPDC049111]|uniref:diguanylate cyclase domain-containing protein n=1 Tax=Catellatospora sp. NPDC049111 TaxID=3155271 RepID=UPI0033DB1283